MKIRLTGLLLLLCVFMMKAEAQEKLTLSLSGAVEHALKYNKTIINSDYAVDKAQQALREAIANGLPQANAKVDYSNAMGASMSIRFNPEMPATEIPIKPTSNFNLQVTQLIFNGSYLVGIQTARLYKELSQMSKVKSETDVKTQVTDSYYLVLVSQELLDKLELNLKNLKDLYKKTETLAKVGVIEQNDADQLFIQVGSLQNAVNASERQLELATNMLRLQLGASTTTAIELTDKLESILDNSNAEAMLLQNFKLENNIDYMLMNQQVGISKKMVDLKKTQALPSIAGFYTFTKKILTSNFDMAPKNMIGLQVNIPIFSSGVRHFQTKQAYLDLKSTQNNRDLVSDQLQMQEKQLRFNLTNSLETFTTQKSNIEVSRRVYNSLKLKYEQGMISGLDLITADNNYLKAETDYISSILQLLQARLQLEKMLTTSN